MPIYEIEQYELYKQTYKIEAGSFQEALDLFVEGDPERVCIDESSFEYSEVADRYGWLCGIRRIVLPSGKEIMWDSLQVMSDSHRRGL